ncbi:small-conductance mechanosensitive channel [Sphingomonas jejuensis]|uniref:Small-conductance mechanosensitive channel n=1 Tax=Sphingomonas jejuensis TaxID=904715 RepID=A0ABX0XJ12_9SPHN|nr:mechanosensitive ion channel domain-containing protein [Sphingomonas jejuensis]NJC33327.1 small-conductance mechanosensitive channel [Sphingomonas jejuensis]
MRQIDMFGWDVPAPLVAAGAIALAVLAGLLIHATAFRLLRRFAERTPATADDILVSHARRPARWITVAVALALIRPAVNLSESGDTLWRQVAGLVVPALIGWLAIAMLRAFQKVVEIRADISVEDNLRARRQRTRASILTRIGVFAIIFVTLCLMLLSIPSVRSVGVTLMASAGIAGLVVGAAAQPALKNVIAGVQMAFSEPIRIDDVVIIDGEWGRIEEIRLTFVQVKLWDERRLIVPVSKFLEQSFQNWTRETSHLLGSVFWRLDPAADIDRLRDRLGALVDANPRWDRRFWNMQVTDMTADAVEVRALATAKDASTAFDLRCDLREGLLKFIRDEMPEALPKTRALVEAGSSASVGAENERV